MYYLSVLNKISGRPEQEDLVPVVEVWYVSMIMYIVE